MYLRGGIFLVTYKVLMLDLVSKRFDPQLISGMIINQNQGVRESLNEMFLAKILSQENPVAWIKWVTDRP